MQALSPLRSVPRAVAMAGEALARGEPVLLFDAADREGETDLVFLSEKATPELLRLLRQDAGGLICVAVSDEFRRRLNLPMYSDMLEESAARFPLLGALRTEKLRYDVRSPFGIHVNHRSNFTGIPDRDRATTIRAIGELVRSAETRTDAELSQRFASEFSSPGHVPILFAARGLARERKGHTELGISIARMAGLSESVTVCEMLGDSGGARSVEAARAYADAHGWVFLEGATITEAYRTWSG